MHLESLAIFDRLGDAQAFRQQLQEAGFHASIKDDSKLQRFWFLTKPCANYQVAVTTPEFDKAQDWVTQHADKIDCSQAICCPECHSYRVQYPQYTRKFIMPIIVEHLMSMGFAPKEYYCQNCQWTWPREAQTVVDRDTLGWPLLPHKDRHQKDPKEKEEKIVKLT